MKLIKYLVFILILALYACEEEKSVVNDHNSEVINFLTCLESINDNALYLMKLDLTTNTYSFTKLNNNLPYYKQNEYISFNSGNYSYSNSEGKIIYGNILGSSGEVPNIPIKEGYDFCNPVTTHTISFSDGRVGFIAKYGYDFGNGTFSSLYFYNPATNEFSYFGDLDDYALSQPEALEDTESGDIIDNGFAKSKDENYIYCTMIAWGVEANSIHTDYYQILRYNLIDGGFQKVATSSNEIIGISSDGKYLVTSYSDGSDYGFEIFNVSSINNITSIKVKIDDYNGIYQHNISKNSNSMVITWRGGGIGQINLESGTYKELVLSKDMTNTYKGLGYGINSLNGNEFYFNAALDYNTNSNIDFTLFKYTNQGLLDSIITIKDSVNYSLFYLIE